MMLVILQYWLILSIIMNEIRLIAVCNNDVPLLRLDRARLLEDT